MSRVKRGVAAHKKHKKLLSQAEGRRASKHKLVRPAREAAMHALRYAYGARRRRLVQPTHGGASSGGDRPRPKGPRGHGDPRPQGVPPLCRPDQREVEPADKQVIAASKESSTARRGEQERPAEVRAGRADAAGIRSGADRQKSRSG